MGWLSGYTAEIRSGRGHGVTGSLDWVSLRGPLGGGGLEILFRTVAWDSEVGHIPDNISVNG